eukprot:CAMPEP_0119148870 /NCGR_PEP_ID=MMETSP1310-20130426/42507_1 /TAXON_ID=464262 /ORGANISM="Genus nov. species nov., Strain RCC2339" /LENGTH=219 /DNA_ID=CAMNT_0007140933 /DNA_START=283 /DNA_END=939 /DNA_ORIENTATION=-
MQESVQSSIDTAPVADALDIDHNIQQDVQEFLSLFFDFLSGCFEKSSNEKTKEVMNVFGGMYAYQTKCSTCGVLSRRGCKFQVLDFAIRGHSITLEEMFSAFLSEEQLVHPNKYFCENCNGLQNAKRWVTLCNAPEVLYVQALRYIYDPELMRKVKIHSIVDCPLGFRLMDIAVDDQGKCALDGELRAYDYRYILGCVLLHAGETADTGHYVSYVRDRN